MSDRDFDKLTRDLLKYWDSIEHVHKHLISKEMLNASTGFTLKYPTITKHSAMSYLESLTAYQIDKYTKQKTRRK